jgi:hypothetical protein
MSIIKNAVIESVSIDMGDRGLLTAWLHLDYGDSGQGFGGFVLYLPKSYKNHTLLSHAGHFIFRCMEIAGVEKWQDMKGKTIRVLSDNDGLSGKIEAIGHIVKDEWFFPAKDFETNNS